MLKRQKPEQEIVFCGDYLPFATQQIEDQGFGYITDFAAINPPFCLIIDDYQINQDDINHWRDKAEHLIAIDDFNHFDLSQCDLVINFRVGFDNEPYTAKSTCLGAKFFPFKSSLQAIREDNLSTTKTSLDNIFIFIGGQDQHNTGMKLMTALDNILSGKVINLVTATTTADKPIPSSRNTLWLKPLTSKIEHYYQAADYFISGGGLSKYEVSFCGIANACISQNQGQAEDSVVFAKHGLTTDLGLVDNFLLSPEQSLTTLVADIEAPAQSALISASKQTFDTHSCRALADHILKRCYD